MAPPYNENIIYLLYKKRYLNEEVNNFTVSFSLNKWLYSAPVGKQSMGLTVGLRDCQYKLKNDRMLLKGEKGNVAQHFRSNFQL